MRTFTLKKMSIPKLAVLATGLAAAVLVATINPAPAMATPRAADCAGCHTGSTSAATTAVPSTANPAAGATYTVAITLAANPLGGNTGYGIVAVSPTPAPSPAVFGGDTGSQLSFTATMVAPASAGTYSYTVYTNQGSRATGQTGSKVYTITVGDVVTVPPTTVPPTTVPPTTVPPTTVPPTTVPPTTVSEAPGVPTEVTAVAANGGAIVFWEPPANAADDTLYTVTASPGGSFVTTGSDAAIFTGLTNGTEYTFTVVAFNEFGTSAESAVSNTVIPAVVVIPTTTTPAATTTTPAVSGNAAAVAPVGGPDTGAGGASNLR